jgi:opacity protein-like surface antigen
MKKIILIVLSACVVASTSLAAGSEAPQHQKIRIGASVYYTRVAMDQLNKQLDKGTNVTNLKSGIAVMLNFDLVLVPSILVGARAGYLHCRTARSSYNYILYNQKTTIKSSLIPLEAGLGIHIRLPATPISIMGGVYIGYGFAFASYKNDITTLGQTTTFTQPFHGGRLIGELLAGVGFKLSSAVSININVGYRLAKIRQMIQSEDVTYNSIPGLSIPVGAKGDVLKDSDKNDLVFNFSGFNVGAGLSFGF